MSNITLYDDQQELIEKIRQAWRQYKKFVVYSPTGGGKTRIAAKIIEGCINNGLKVCFVVPRISLIGQTADSFKDLGLSDITYLWADMPYDSSAKICIASAQTYIRRNKIDFDLTIIDECDLRAKQLLLWMKENPQDRYIGLTATPFAPWLGEYYGEIVKGRDMKWMIQNGRLANYEVYAPTKPDMDRAKITNTTMGKDYREDDAFNAMDKPQVYGDIVTYWLENAENKLTIAGCVNQNHAKHLCLEFNKAGVPAEIIIDKTKIYEREEIFKRAKEGITKVLVSVDCLTEGFDMPEAEVLINARPTKSERRYIQFCGRILRAFSNKIAKIFDHSGTTIELGFPDDIPIPDVLINKSDGLEDTAKRKQEEIEKLEKLPKQCPSCNFIKEAGAPPKCPKCGFMPLVGEDVPTDRTAKLEALKREAEPKKATQEEKARFYRELVGYQKQMKAKGKNYKQGYLDHLYKAKFGVYPTNIDKRKMSPPSISTLNFIKSRNIRFAKKQNKRG